MKRLFREHPFAASVGLAVLLAFVPYRAFLTDAVPAGRDLLFYFYPQKAHLAEAVRHGEVPWIDRYRWGGTPLLGAPGAAPFDPGNLLFVLLPLGTAVKAWILLRLATAVAGFGFLARRWGLSPLSAAVAGLLYGLSGVSVSLTPFLAAYTCLSLLPWFAAFLLMTRQRPFAAGPFAGLTMVTALLVLASCPEFLLYAAAIGVATLVGSLPETGQPSRRSFRFLASWAAAAVLAAGLAAPAILPALATIQKSARGPGAGLTIVYAADGALPTARLGEMFLDVADRASVWETGSAYPYLPSLTPGRIAWLLVLVGLVRRGPGRIAAACLAVTGLLLAVGQATPVWTAAARFLPLVGSMRFPEKHAILTGYALAFLAMLGLMGLERRLSERARPVVLGLLLAGILVDREAAARELLLMRPSAVLRSPPPLLASLPRSDADGPPPRVFHRNSYVSGTYFRVHDLALQNRMMSDSLFPGYASLFGAGYILEHDYDLTLPLDCVVWGRLLTEAVPSGSDVPYKVARALGVQAVVLEERLDSGAWAFRLRHLKDPVSPYRFAERIAREENGRLLIQRLLKEGFDAKAAYVVERAGAPGAETRASPGRVLTARDLPSGLDLTVEVDGPGSGALMLYRLRDAALETELDGVRQEPLEVAFGFTLVRVPEGRHRLRLRPETRWVKIGAVTSLAAAGLLLAVARLFGKGPRNRA